MIVLVKISIIIAFFKLKINPIYISEIESNDILFAFYSNLNFMPLP